VLVSFRGLLILNPDSEAVTWELIQDQVFWHMTPCR